MPPRPSGDPVPHPPYRGKRALDLALLAIAAVPSLLVGLACALAIRLTSPGPVFFRQERIGMRGVPFQVWKFRTMVDEVNPIFPDPDRITSVGRVLRRSSLDELPQLLNVLSGRMSLVGPRPPLPTEAAAYADDVRRRLAVKPGMTGLWQVSGRSDLSWEEAVRLDLRYVENWSLSLDLVILLRTVTAVARSSGAY
jgi:lipopolysaccharide/colanic/teichoic acid biosynthesis glycosyltransferase